MVKKIALALFAIIALAAIAVLVIQISNSMTGQYSAAGGGRWYYGPQRVQLEPGEACMNSGYDAIIPPRVYTNEFGTMMSMCRYQGSYMGVPLVQTIEIR